MIIRRLGADERGATAIEYGLIVALIAVASIGGMQQLGGGVGGKWGNIASTMNTYMN
jgi:pilus assembly protein Flp/PilA